MNVSYGDTAKFPVNDNVDLVVRAVTITEAGSSPKSVETVEIREYLKSADIYGHGIFLPGDKVQALVNALAKVKGFSL